MKFPETAEDLSKEIGIPLEQWPGNCHGIAEAVLRRVPVEGMRLVRGFFNGFISRNSVYKGGGVQQHSWLELADGRILDPTRWAMTNPGKPAIYIGYNDHYDEAGLMMRAQHRPAMSFSMMMSQGKGNSPSGHVLKKIRKMDALQVRDLFDAGNLTPPAGEPQLRDADRLYGRIYDPVEHFDQPEDFFSGLQAAGLKAIIPIDTATRVLSPEEVTVDRGANLLYGIDAPEEISGVQKLFKVFCRFISIEERELHLENELEEIGYKLEELHDALNEMESWLKHDPEAGYLPSSITDTLSVIASDILGRGFGVELAVERYAKSIGLSRNELHCEMVKFGNRANYDLRWLCGDEAQRVEAQDVDLKAEDMPDDISP